MNTQFFQQLFDQHQATMLLIDPNTGQIIANNQAASRFYGYTTAQLNGLSIYEISVLSIQEMNARREAALQQKQNLFIAPHRLASNEIRTVEVDISPITWENSTFLLAIIHDITARVQAQEALQQSEQKLHTIFELLPVGISVLDTANQIVYMNPALESILQISDERLMHGDYRERKYVRADGTPMLAEEFASSRAIHEQHAIYNIETGIVTENSDIIWTNISAIPVNFADWRVIIVTVDITKRKRLEEMLRAKQEQQHLQMMRRVLAKQKQEQVMRAREEEHLLHELFEAIPLPVFYKDPQGRYLACNQAFATMAEIAKSEIIGKTAFEITPETYARNYHAADLALMAQPQVKVYEYNVYHPALQQELTFLMTKSVIKNVDDQVTGIVGVITDITRQKRLEVLLQERLEFFQLMLEKHNAIMLLIDPFSGQIIESNLAARQFYGYSVAQMSGMNIADINILTQAEIAQEQQRALAEERNYFIFPHRLASGEIRTVEVHSSPIIWKNGQVLFSIIHDITERKRLEADLQESEERWQYALEGNGDGIWDWNTQTNYVFFSRRWKEMLGYAEDEISSNFSEWDKRLHPDDKAATYEKLTAHLRGEAAYYLSEHRLLHRDGSYRWILARGKVMNWVDASKPLRMVGTHTDITERKLIEQTLQASEARYRALEIELRQLNAQKDRFLAIIAHDLRNPFSVILGFSNYLNETWETVEKNELQIAVESIQSSAQNLYKLLENLLTWSQLQQDSLAFEPIELNINVIGQEILTILELNATPKQIILYNLAQPEHLAYGDYNMVSTIMRNLLSNAIKFTPNNGQVTLSTQAKANFIKVTITDSGVGISPENQAKLFHLDTKFKTEGTAGETGTGLGLLLCQQLVHKNSGEIGVTSVEGQGSTFYFTLPKFSP